MIRYSTVCTMRVSCHGLLYSLDTILILRNWAEQSRTGFGRARTRFCNFFFIYSFCLSFSFHILCALSSPSYFWDSYSSDIDIIWPDKQSLPFMYSIIVNVSELHQKSRQKIVNEIVITVRTRPWVRITRAPHDFFIKFETTISNNTDFKVPNAENSMKRTTDSIIR